MKSYVGVRDNQWFDVVSHIPGIDKVNFWQARYKSDAEDVFYLLL
jgi:hypothetical protein